MSTVGEFVVFEGQGWEPGEGRLVAFGSGKPHDVPAENAVVQLLTDVLYHRDPGASAQPDAFRVGDTVQMPIDIVRSKAAVEAEQGEFVDHEAEAARCAELAEERLGEGGELERADPGAAVLAAEAQAWATLSLMYATAEQTTLIKPVAKLGERI